MAIFPRVTITNELKTPLDQAIYKLLMSQNLHGYVSAEAALALQEQYGVSEKEFYFALLPFATNYAYPTLSKFMVGAVVQDIDGNFYFGGNQEYAGLLMQYTVHAEQCALNHAYLSGARGVKAIIVNYSPCGHCRQFINELNTAKELKIYLPQIPDGAPLSHYLPDDFGPADLDISTRLFSDNQGRQSRFVGQKAQALASVQAEEHHCYSPYSHSNAFALLTVTGSLDQDKAAEPRHYVGRYIENAAYNPSFPAVLSAITLARVYGEDGANFSELVLSEQDSPLLVGDYAKVVAETFGWDFTKL